MSLGEVDTLNLLTEKLESLFNDTQGYYEGMVATNGLYKDGKIAEKEFFAKLGDYTVACSALEFLAVKVIIEIKKSLDKMAGGHAPGGTQSPGLMPGTGVPGPGGMPPRAGTADAPVGAPPRVIASEEFGQPGTLPSPDPSLVSHMQPRDGGCSACGAPLRKNAKFCSKCGNRM